MLELNGVKVLFQFVIVLLICIVLVYVGDYVLNKIKNNSSKALNPREYLPEEEIQTLKQVFYLIVMSLFFIDFLYSVIYIGGNLFYFALFDIVISIYAALSIDKSSWKNKIIGFFILPFGSLSFILFNLSLVGILEVIHIPLLLYFVIIFNRKFMDYTKSNGLGITIILLFVIVFISFLITTMAEGVYPLDSINMVSNAFTSNGYTVLGKSDVGKLNSIVLVWSGYVISGVGTATLTSAILLRHFNKRIKKLEELIKDEGDK